MLERMNESIEAILGKKVEKKDEEAKMDSQSENKFNKYHLDGDQLEILNILSSYSDFYHSNVDVARDNEIKYSYVS